MDISKNMDWKALAKNFKTKKKTLYDSKNFIKISLGA